MIKCNEIYDIDVIFATDTRSPIIKLATILHEEGNTYEDWVNADLYEMLTHDSESVGDATGEADTLSIDYLLNRQDKYFSPLYERMLNHYGSNYDNLAGRIALILITKFLKGWSKLADAFFADYNPIQNYDMKEHEESDGTNKVATEMTDSTETHETIINKYNGFNNSNAVKVSESTNDGEGSKTTSGTQAKNETAIDNERDLTRSGNIGVTTSQQMIESEYNLRKKNLLDIIYKDIDSVLFIDIY